MKKFIYKIMFFIIFILIFSCFFIGLFDFKEKILSLQKHSNTLNSNVVILTGGSNRIKDGLKIINNVDKFTKANLKILISGTGKGFTKISLKKMLTSNFNLKLLECCIELESISKNTYSNASETYKWVTLNNINKFILITSNYHMPRAILEFKNKMPNLEIFTYPISPKNHNISKWLSSSETFSLIFVEYSKLLIASLRIKILNI
ncbi:YdcF family protein [Alphaproteobacteria bacterium]|nr:YdcF family protein [Alphaproteobacteria bacterium]